MPQQPPDVLAAGAVVSRPGKQVLLVHRPRYDDWSFPKGKLDPGEHPAVAAVREVGEETGLRVRLGPPLSSQRYEQQSGRMKTVSYWTARVVGDDDVSGYLVNDEIDQLGWFTRAEARRILTYDYDRATLEETRGLRKQGHAVVVLRHAAARPRESWSGDDRRRPLAPEGEDQALRLAPLLAAYDVAHVVTSDSTRCVDTVAPYAAQSGWPLDARRALSEEDATARKVARVVDELVHADEASVLCTHRPVLPAVLDALGVPDPTLDPGAMVVVHLRKGTVVATETHQMG